MKKIVKMATVCIMLLFLGACGKSAVSQIAEQIELGQRYLAEMKYDEAIVAFNKVIELDAKNTKAYHGLGQVYGAMTIEMIQNENYEGAREFLELARDVYEIVLGISNEDLEATAQLASIAEMLDKIDELERASESSQFEDSDVNVDNSEPDPLERILLHINKDILFENANVIRETLMEPDLDTVANLLGAEKEDEYYFGEGIFLAQGMSNGYPVNQVDFNSEYSDEEWPEIAEIKQSETLKNALMKLGLTEEDIQYILGAGEDVTFALYSDSEARIHIEESDISFYIYLLIDDIRIRMSFGYWEEIDITVMDEEEKAKLKLRAIQLFQHK